ncbi:hypothetical protein Mmol_0261 [Methylotenera mobilis JLW8]|uniref:Uncharacterized protein n=1 Tax=Methylotenera mobilis (strain JLW8 / ATCC BAA-1282 / DSM 17540) TaxID=583345 RepID=C6WSS9_METML|nr:hypothetical protein Mmol_0261 [Methylotenera mobilis JLW8]
MIANQLISNRRKKAHIAVGFLNSGTRAGIELATREFSTLNIVVFILFSAYPHYFM